MSITSIINPDTLGASTDFDLGKIIKIRRKAQRSRQGIRGSTMIHRDVNGACNICSRACHGMYGAGCKLAPPWFSDPCGGVELLKQAADGCPIVAWRFLQEPPPFRAGEFHQMVSNSYRRISSSFVTSGKDSNRLWAINMRSNGSLWYGGSS